MNKISRLFTEKNREILSIYFTAGFPKLDDTRSIIKELVLNGVDMIEIGIPFSDPLADGPTIQHSSQVALENGMSVKLLFQQLQDLGPTNVPLILMGYLNPVLQYGMEQFCRDASGLGVSGLIIPDLPLQEYLDEYESVFKKYDLKNIFLITPQTSEQRIRLIDRYSDAFIYMVSSASTTGAKVGITEAQESYFKRIRSMNLNNPVVAGFGISDKQTFSKVCEYANGGIIGSAFIKALSKDGKTENKVKTFIHSIRTLAEA